MIKIVMIYDEWVKFVNSHPESFREYAIQHGFPRKRIDNIIKKVKT